MSRPHLTCVSVCLALFTATTGHGEELTPALQVIQSAGPNSADGETVTRAWRKLSQADAAQLPEVLAALDDAGPLAANWISAAVDAIAERALSAEKELPAGQLEQFLLDTKHSPRARRLAFVWLAHVDRSAPDRLIPGMLHDPGVQFRRDAVARLLVEARGLLDGEKPDQAQTVYEKALSGARDLDQVKEIAERLDKLGHPVNLVEHFGFLVDWKLLGPFDNTGERGFDVAYPPEREIDFSAAYEGKNSAVKWIDHTTEGELGMVDLNAALGKENGVAAYAVAQYYSAGEVDLELRLGCINACKVWLNGKLLAEHEVYHSGSEVDQYVARGTVKRGRNQILLKVCQNTQKEDWAQLWEFQLRVCDGTGTAILSAAMPDTP